MKKILFISQYLNRNGTEAFMMNVFRAVDRTKIQIDFLIFDDKETVYTHEVESSGSIVYRLPNRKQSKLKYYAIVNHFFREHQGEYSAAHFCGMSLSSSAPIVYAWFHGIKKIIVHAHGSSTRGLHNRLLHRLKRGLVRRISTHQFACSTLAANWFFGEHPAVIINNGIDVKKFEYNDSTRIKIREELGIGESTKVIGHVGRFVPEKNHEFVLDVFAQYSKINSDSLLILVGIGPLMENAKTKVEALGIKDKVIFLGERLDVNELMQAMDLFLMPSLFEGLPFVLIEAQCAGLPCIVSDTVNMDICLTENLKFISLHQKKVQWAYEIENTLVNCQRTDQSVTICKKGFSIESTINYLEAIYES